MGVFISASGVIDCSKDALHTALAETAAGKGGTFFAPASEAPESEKASICSLGDRHFVLYPKFFMEWDETSAALSSALSRPVFSLHIHDSDLWMFNLFVQGKDVARFNPRPDYWGDVSDEDRARWVGDAAEVARHIPGLAAASIAKYLVPWGEDDEASQKAYSGDEYPTGDEWQLIDFMRAVGLKYPDEGSPGLPVAFRLAPVAAPKRPWWKLW